MSGHQRPSGIPWQPTLSPLWIVEPYADRRACWGCGMKAAERAHPVTGLRLCSYCRELHEVDQHNQAQAMAR